MNNIEDEIEGYKKLLRIANCPESLISNPTFLFGKPTGKDYKWAYEAINKYKAALQKQQSNVSGEWISVEEKPLVSITDLGWEVNEGIPDEFFGALQVNNNETGKTYWWMRHCVIEDRIGLCVVGDDDNEPAGWEIKDIEFYMPLPAPPNETQSTEQSNESEDELWSRAIDEILTWRNDTFDDRTHTQFVDDLKKSFSIKRK